MVTVGRMIDRPADRQAIRAALKRSRVVALLGPRQCGKTTLAREFVAADSLNYFDLEDPASLARLSQAAALQQVTTSFFPLLFEDAARPAAIAELARRI